jgi:pilus assembly protein CpaE
MAQLVGRIVSDDNEFKSTLGRLMRSGTTPMAIMADTVTRESAATDIIVVDVRGELHASMQLVEQLRGWSPASFIIAIANEADPNLILKAMRAGVSEFLVYPPTEDAFNEAIRHAITRRDQSNEAASVARLMVFLGGKGGSGTTTVAVNSAVDIARLSKSPTMIVDLKPGLGEVALFLGVRPKYSLVDAIDNLSRLDKHVLQSLVVKHKSGLDILAGSDHFDRPGPSDATAIGDVFRVLARHYDYILVDAGNLINPQSVAVLGNAELVFIVVTPDVPSIRNGQRLISRLRQLGAHKDRVRIVLNRAMEPFPIPPKQIETALGQKIHHMFLSDYKIVSTALNSGVPLAQSGKTELATQFDRFSRELLSPPKEEVSSGTPKKVASLSRTGWLW